MAPVIRWSHFRRWTGRVDEVRAYFSLRTLRRADSAITNQPGAMPFIHVKSASASGYSFENAP